MSKSKKRLVVLSGAGISAESGLKTFRDGDGLWEGHDVTEVATPEGWQRNPELVNRFYNERRKNVIEANPNPGHEVIAQLEDLYDVRVVTQNIDDLHERAGSTNVIHLHGEIKKVRSSANPELLYDLEGWELKIGEKCEEGSQLRPHIVWFGEAVPMMDRAISEVLKAEIFLVVGTSLVVYPAASLVDYAKRATQKFVVDPSIPQFIEGSEFECVAMPASEGMKVIGKKLGLTI